MDSTQSVILPSHQDALDAYWARRLGCVQEDLRRPGAVVVADRALPYRCLVVFRRGQSVVVRAHPSVAGSLDPQGLGEGFSHPPRPRLLLSLHPANFQPFHAPGTRELTEADADALAELTRAGPPHERDVADVSLGHDTVFGCFLGDRLVSAASSVLADGVADVGVATHPEYRGRGYGKSVVSALCSWAFGRGALMLYQVDEANEPSLRLAVALGFRLYAVEEEQAVP